MSVSAKNPRLRQYPKRCAQSKLVTMYKSLNFILSVVFLFLISCSGSESYDTAYSFQKDGKTYIKLKGKKRVGKSSLGSILFNDKHEDSLILQVPTLKDGIIEGRDIPAKPGFYDYGGDVVIKDEMVFINLNHYHPYLKRLDTSLWNGKYELKRSK